MPVTTSPPAFAKDDAISLQMAVRGCVVIPDNKIEYQYQVNRMHNASFHDRRPLMFVLCKDHGDVREVLQFASRQGVPISVRSSGHSICGSSCRDGTIVIDVGGINHADYDPTTEQLTIGPGTTNGDVNVVLMRYGRMACTGMAPVTAMGGLALHGGIGWLMHRFGTCAENITAATVILADGTVRNVDSKSVGEDKELFFGIRGAAGILGIVMSFTIRTYPMESCTGGLWMMQDDDRYTHTRQLIKLMENKIQQQESRGERTLFGLIILARFPSDPTLPEDLHGKPATMVLSGAWGEEKRALETLKPFMDREIKLGAPPTSMPFGVFNQLFAGHFIVPQVLATYGKGAPVQKISEESIDAVADKWCSEYEPWLSPSMVGVEFVGGNAGESYSQMINNRENEPCVENMRQYRSDFIFWLYFPAGNDTYLEKSRQLCREMDHLVMKDKVCSYSNLLSDVDIDDIKKETELTFTGIHRLRALKALVDPENIFTRNVIPVGKTRNGEV